MSISSDPDSAGPGDPDATGLPESAIPEKSAAGAIPTLRLLLIATILAPILLGTIAACFSYRASYRTAGKALTEAAAVAEENTTKVLDTHLLVAARIDDLLAPLSDTQIHSDEKALHDRIAKQIADLPQVAAAWVLDANGRELVSARVFPVNRDLDNADREDFRALRDTRANTFVAALRARSLDGGEYRPYFTVSRARRDANGQFRGVTVVAVSGGYFASFYNSLLGGSAQYAASVLRDDGTLLARYPADADLPLPVHEEDLMAKAMADKATGGLLGGASLFHLDGSLVAYQRLADYPVYVAIGRSRAAIFNEWFRSMLGYLAIGVPAAVGFFLLSLLALRRTRREQHAWAQARDAMAQRAAIGAQLQQAQKMEAVGLLTAGIAHDFNNLLTVVTANMELLRPSLQDLDPRRQRLVTGVISACEKATALTMRLLSFARSDPVDPRPVEVNELITNMSEMLWRSVSDPIAVDFRLAPGLPPVMADPFQLENALLNLTMNARDAMPDRGRLTIETAIRLAEDGSAAPPDVAPGPYVAIAISDTGQGMPPEVRDRAFDPFFTTKTAGKGTGLGLAQVHGFVTRSGGYCTIDSEPDRGTTVTLCLPIYAGSAQVAGASPRHALAAPPK